MTGEIYSPSAENAATCHWSSGAKPDPMYEIYWTFYFGTAKRKKNELTVLRVFLRLRPFRVNGPWTITCGTTSSENIWSNSEHQSRRLNVRFSVLYNCFGKSCNVCFIMVNFKPRDCLLTSTSSYINYTANVLSTFRHVRKIVKTKYYLCQSCLSAQKISAPNGAIFRKFWCRIFRRSLYKN